MRKTFGILSSILLLFASCSSPVAPPSYYDIPADVKEVYRFECQVSPTEFINDLLGSYTDPGLRAILKDIGGPAEIEPNAFFDALLTKSKSDNYKLGENFYRANPVIFEEGGSDEDVIVALKSEYSKILAANLERFHEELKNKGIVHNLYLSGTDKLVLELVPAGHYKEAEDVLMAEKSNFIQFKPANSLGDNSSNMSYMFEVTEERIKPVDVTSVDLFAPPVESQRDTANQPYGPEFWSRFMPVYTYNEQGIPDGFSPTGELGYAKISDTSYINGFLETYKDSMPFRFYPAWGEPIIDENGSNTGLLYLYFLNPGNPLTAINPADILSAEAKESEYTSGQWLISLTFSENGAKKWGDLTSSCVGGTLAILIDNTVISAPMVDEGIYGGVCEISGQFNEESANDLAMRINHSLSAYPMTVVKQGLATLSE